MAKHSEPSAEAASSAKQKKSPIMLIGVAVLALAIGGGTAASQGCRECAGAVCA